MVNNEVVTRIARKIRATRLEKKLTIQQLATRTRVSKGLLSKIENLRTVPSLPVFVTLIQSLDISLKDFFKDLLLTDGKSCKVTRRRHYLGENTNDINGVVRHHILLQNIPESTMEATVVRIDGSESGKISTGTGYVFAFVLSGSCKILIDGDQVILEEGDIISLDGSTDHAISSDVTSSILTLTFVASG